MWMTDDTPFNDTNDVADSFGEQNLLHSRHGIRPVSHHLPGYCYHRVRIEQVITVVSMKGRPYMTVQQRELHIVQSQVVLGDPHVNTDNRDRLSVRFAVYDALVRRDESGAFVPRLATAWSCLADARTWTLRLREDVVFHDGKRMTAADVVATLERVSDPDMRGEMATQGVFAVYLAGASFTAVSEHVVEIVTAEPLADLLDLLVDVPIVRAGFSDDVPNGTGPYRVLSSGGDALLMEAFVEHWNRTPQFPAIRWRAEPNAERRATMLLAGNADLVTDLDASGTQAVGAAATATVVEAAISTCVAFLFNVNKGVCSDRRVRQALNYGADVERLVADVADGAASRTNGPLSQLAIGYDPGLAPYPFDPERARALLAEAGYADGLKITLDVPEVMPDESRELARRLADEWAELSVLVTVREFADRLGYAQMVRAKQIDDACCFDSSPLSTFRVLREKLHSGVAGPWWQGYANPEVDRLIDTAAATVDDAERQRIYQQVSGIVHDDAPWLFLYSPRVAFGVGPALAGTGWRPALNGLITLD